jgi:hypothetical protein
LSVETYVGEYTDKELHSKLNSIDFPGKSIPGAAIKGITVDSVYWRKANAIHNWFVQNVQGGVDDCGKYTVTNEDLLNLLHVINTVLADPEEASELLPVTSGFFFGSIEYDEWYFDGIQNTIEILEGVLSDTSADYYYSSSW